MDGSSVYKFSIMLMLSIRTLCIDVEILFTRYFAQMQVQGSCSEALHSTQAAKCSNNSAEEVLHPCLLC